MRHHDDPSAAASTALVESLETIAARLGAIVRADVGDATVLAGLLIGHGRPVLTLNTEVVGTPAQSTIVTWATEIIVSGGNGFHIRRA